MIAFREMKMEDVPGVAVLEKELFADAWSEKSIEETLGQDNTFCFVAEDKKGFCGYLLVYYVLDECEIARVGVPSRMRRQGVASFLLHELVMFCHANSILKILLDVRESNEGARAFYKRSGFAEDGIRKNFYTDPVEHAVLMSRNL